MSEIKTLNVASQLCKMPVIVPDTSERIGNVSDVIVHPTEGRMLGLVLRTMKGEERAIAEEDCFVFGDVKAVLVAEAALIEIGDIPEAMPGGVRVCRELIGADVVTETGELLGEVNEVYVIEEPAQMIYRITASALQRYFGGGFFMAGDVPRFFWRSSARMIVPIETKTHLAAPTLDRAIGLRREIAALNGVRRWEAR